MLKNRASFFTNPYLLLTLTVLFWSGNMVVGRGIRGDVPPMALSFWRWAIAFLCVLPLALPHLRTQWPLIRKGWKPIVERKDPLPDAEEWAKVKDKLDKLER